MIVFLDPKTDRGGGQVVLERLLQMAVARLPTALVMPEVGFAKVTCPDRVHHVATSAGLPGMLSTREPVTLVCNAHAALPDLVRTTSRLRRDGHPVTTLAILHNYPIEPAKKALTHALLRRVDTAIAVEPGLARLRRDARIPSWLSVQDGSRARALSQSSIRRTGVVKCYARPDRSKGLHLLPQIFPALEREGLTCRVAVGSAPLQQQDRYRDRLLATLRPWTVDGSRTADWIDPGDIFLVPSIGGEAACLSAQEALSNGAFVVASRLGLMTYLSPTNDGIRTFAVRKADDAVRAAREVAGLPEDDFTEELRISTRTMAERAGRWYDETMSLIASHHAALTAETGATTS